MRWSGTRRGHTCEQAVLGPQIGADEGQPESVQPHHRPADGEDPEPDQQPDEGGAHPEDVVEGERPIAEE